MLFLKLKVLNSEKTIDIVNTNNTSNDIASITGKPKIIIKNKIEKNLRKKFFIILLD